jgi:hypothetical protein
MIRIPMEKWERTLCRLKKHQWQRMGATRTQTVEYTEMALAEDGVTYIDHTMARDGISYIVQQEYMCLEFQDPRWETWFRLRYSNELADLPG